ncbi:DUF4398 domain-containing protein [Myxococcota bacterium]
MTKVLVLGMSAVVSLAVACGGAAVPHDKVTAAEAEMRAAEVGGASDVQQAALHLKLAQDQIVKGKALIQEGENEEAALVLDCAQTDAQYALALAKEETAKKEAEAAAKEVAELKRKTAKGP